jgi:hypothetical protein
MTQHIDIHIAYGGQAVHATTTDGESICPRCRALRRAGEAGYIGHCHTAQVWIDEVYGECDHFEEAERGQRTLL